MRPKNEAVLRIDIYGDEAISKQQTNVLARTAVTYGVYCEVVPNAVEICEQLQVEDYPRR